MKKYLHLGIILILIGCHTSNNNTSKQKQVPTVIQPLDSNIQTNSIKIDTSPIISSDKKTPIGYYMAMNRFGIYI